MAVLHDRGGLALDIGAKAHTWAADLGGALETGEVDNTPAGLRALLRSCLGRIKRLRVLLEALGVYYLDVALLAHELGAEVVVVNPRWTPLRQGPQPAQQDRQAGCEDAAGMPAADAVQGMGTAPAELV